MENYKYLFLQTCKNDVSYGFSVVQAHSAVLFICPWIFLLNYELYSRINRDVLNLIETINQSHYNYPHRIQAH